MIMEEVLLRTETVLVRIRFRFNGFKSVEVYLEEE
jgi:hypothetical protein